MLYQYKDSPTLGSGLPLHGRGRSCFLAVPGEVEYKISIFGTFGQNVTGETCQNNLVGQVFQ